MNPLVSIIIPTFNRGHLIGETLDSIRRQSYINWECIVIDDGSTDSTAELVNFYCKKDSRFKFYQRPIGKPKGANACRNYGFELSSGEFINWFDDDDLIHPDKIKLQLQELRETEENFSVCQTVFFEEAVERWVEENENISSEQPFFDYLRMYIGFHTPAPLWRKKFLLGMKYLFDEDLHAAQEWEFHLRVLRKSPDYLVINSPLVFIRRHGNNVTNGNNEKKRVWEYFRARLKIYLNLKDLSPASRNFLKNYLLSVFKKMVVDQNHNILKAYKQYILKDNEFGNKSKINAMAAIISFKLFRKGNLLLQKIKYPDH